MKRKLTNYRYQGCFPPAAHNVYNYLFVCSYEGLSPISLHCAIISSLYKALRHCDKETDYFKRSQIHQRIRVAIIGFLSKLLPIFTLTFTKHFQWIEKQIKISQKHQNTSCIKASFCLKDKLVNPTDWNQVLHFDSPPLMLTDSFVMCKDYQYLLTMFQPHVMTKSTSI